MKDALSRADILVAASQADVTDTSESSLVAADAQLRYYVFSAKFTNDDATVATRVDLLDGTSGTILHSFMLAAVNGSDEATFPEGLPLTKGKAIIFVCGTTSAQVRGAVTYKALSS